MVDRSPLSLEALDMALAAGNAYRSLGRILRGTWHRSCRHCQTGPDQTGLRIVWIWM
jgi:hypothetical protein